jgi:hypothetical protein
LNFLGDAWQNDGYPTLSPTLTPTQSPEKVAPIVTDVPTASPVWKGELIRIGMAKFNTRFVSEAYLLVSLFD